MIPNRSKSTSVEGHDDLNSFDVLDLLDGNVIDPSILQVSERIEPKYDHNIENTESEEEVEIPQVDADFPKLDVEVLSLNDCSEWTEIRKVSTNEKVVFLTFDAGSTIDAFSNIITALKSHQAHASFFLTGVWMNRYPTETLSLIQNGHDIYNHSYDHPDFKTLNEAQIHEQLDATSELAFQITGTSTKPFFRPPYGSRDQRVVSTLCREGYYTMYWNSDPLDWKSGEEYTSEKLETKIIDALSPGTIYLLHIGSSSTKDGIVRIVDRIYEQGYYVSPLSKAFTVQP